MNAMPKLFYEYVSRCMELEFINFISSNFSINTFNLKKDWITVTLVPRELVDSIVKLSNTNVLSSGSLCGWIHSGRFVPAPHLFNLSKRYGYKHGCSVVVKPQGVKAFLYGNDVLLASFDHFISPVRKGDYVAVLDSSDMHAIGTGLLLIDRDEVEKLIREGKMLVAIVKNVFDLGIHIRNERFFLY
ncbi:MAG: hypothetical protein QXK24_01030 [Ignisphaera sp.]